MRDKWTAEQLKQWMELGRGIHPENLDPEAMEEAGCDYNVALIPKDYGQRLRQFGNLLAQMCLNHKLKDPKLRMELATIAASLSYLINSSSFRDGEYHAFDEAEVSAKLRRNR